MLVQIHNQTMAVLNDSNEKKALLSLIKFNLCDFFSTDYKEVGVQDTPAVQIVDYETKLDVLEFDMFDTLRYRVMFDKNNITAETHINATFKTKRKRATVEDIQNFTNQFHRLYGMDKDGKLEWTSTDEEGLRNYTYNRLWHTGLSDSFLSLQFKEITGLELHILFLNKLLDAVGEKVKF